jgi:hypothetical protein
VRQLEEGNTSAARTGRSDRRWSEAYTPVQTKHSIQCVPPGQKLEDSATAAANRNEVSAIEIPCRGLG